MLNKILFISRRYPPVIGGMEEYMYQLVTEAEKHLPVYKIVLSKSQVNLLWFIPWSLFYGLFLIYTKEITHVHIGDGVMTCVGFLLKLFSKAKISATVHGLDVTYNKKIYQLYIKFVLKRMPKIVCVSNATLEQCIKRGISKDSLIAIPNGTSSFILKNKTSYKKARAIIENEINLNLENKIILLTVGRLIKRKGVYEFIKNIFPQLSKDYIYCVAGIGEKYNEIKDLIKKMDLEKRVFLLGRVEEKIKFALFEGSDCFVMPNIRVVGDMEGFGIVIVEAGIFGTPVVAFAVDGIVDAVVDGRTGFLVKEGDTKQFVNSINKAIVLNRDKISNEVLQTYSWENIIKKYLTFWELE